MTKPKLYIKSFILKVMIMIYLQIQFQKLLQRIVSLLQKNLILMINLKKAKSVKNLKPQYWIILEET